jgi:sulfoxide reductase heme-binding subunit YedZ
VNAKQTIRWVLKPAVFLAALLPVGLLVLRLWTNNLGADPLKAITNDTGIWALRLLCLTLMITPIRRLTGWNGAIRFRRMLGLFAFFYATVHFLIFIVADRLASLNFPSLAAWQTWKALTLSIGEEILKRPYITMGFISWVCMLALALTSTAGMIRRLGGKRWQLLHRLIYVSAVTGVVHFWWLVKADVREPQAYAVIVGLLLAFRLVWWARRRRAAS